MLLAVRMTVAEVELRRSALRGPGRGGIGIAHVVVGGCILGDFDTDPEAHCRLHLAWPRASSQGGRSRNGHLDRCGGVRILF